MSAPVDQSSVIHTAVQHFMKRNTKAIALGVERICDSKDFPEILDPHGRVWMTPTEAPVIAPDDDDCTAIVAFDMEINIPLEADVVIEAGQIVDLINRMLAEEIECFVEEVTLRYDKTEKRLVVTSQIYWDFPYQ